jgi:hypothetical protein
MDAQIISLEAWKKAHPPALVMFNSNLQMLLAWQQLWLKVIYGSFRK